MSTIKSKLPRCFLTVLVILLFCLNSTDSFTNDGDLKLTFDNLTEWKEKGFKGRTTYTQVQNDGKTVLQAVAIGSASALYKKLNINPAEQPIIKWSWKVKQALAFDNPYRKDVDDFAARVSIFFPGTFLWQYTALVYVWSDSMPVGTIVPSAYNKNIALIVVESGNQNAGVWRNEQRNYVNDYLNFFHKAPPNKMDVAVMTDTDNTKTEATAWYGDILIAREIKPDQTVTKAMLTPSKQK